MFIKNFKLNLKIFSKIFLIVLFIILIVIFFTIIFKAFQNRERQYLKDSNLNENRVMNITTNNYTNVLNTVYRDIDNYTGLKIRFSGFIYRLNDFNQNQFVLGRQMIISSDFKAVIVGFLCELNDAIKYKDGQWVEIEGIIKKGEYNGKIPIIQITGIKEIETPNDEYVYPPTNDYVPVFKML